VPIGWGMLAQCIDGAADHTMDYDVPRDPQDANDTGDTDTTDAARGTDAADAIASLVVMPHHGDWRQRPFHAPPARRRRQ